MKALNTALLNLRRMPYKSLIAILIISLTFFVAHSFALILLGSQQVLEFFEKQPKIIAFFKIETTDTQVQKTKEQFQTDSRIKDLKIVSKDEALKFYQEYQDNPLLLELVTADILPASVEVSAYDPQVLPAIKADLEKNDQIDDVVLQQDVIEQLTNWTRSLRLIGLAVISILTLVSLLVMMTVISLKISYKQKAIAILRFIGANNGYIIFPFILEGMIYGLIGSIIGWGLMFGIYLYLTPWLQNFLGQIIGFPLPGEFWLIQIGAGLAIGVFFGALSSVLATKRLIRK